MIYLLKTAAKYLKTPERDGFCGIRISTRPDAVDVDVLNTLKKYGVTTIELGAQSLNDDVLKSNNRGHTAKDVESASCLIKDNGFKLGLQMMNQDTTRIIWATNLETMLKTKSLISEWRELLSKGSGSFAIS